MLENLNFDVSPGERILLVGDSGSGKSTLLAALAGVLGGDDEGDSAGTLVVEQPLVGLVLQDPDSQVIASRVGDDVAFGCENMGFPREEIWQRVDKSLDMVGLNLPRDHPTKHLSGGQKQRLALAGVIAMGAKLILLDEPTANLDPQGQKDVVKAVDRVVEETGATLVVVEHRYELWTDIVDRIVRLEHGRLIETDASSLVVSLNLPDSRVPGSTSLMSADGLLTDWGPPREFSIPAGSSTLITGENGSGKSTLALTMGGLLAPKSGEMKLAESLSQGMPGQPISWKSIELARRIGTVFQEPEHQFVSRTVQGELEIGPKIMDGELHPSAVERIDDLLDRLRLRHLTQANPFTLSGGEKRRLSVATALVAAPQMLILDEPTFGQDPKTFAELVWLLRDLTESGITVVSVTHDPKFISSLGDHRLEIVN